ncbi:MAG: hypothetical protein K1X72_27750, partial [Pyrinomonadaceae bacterium]|nr:hypothetical protein [Pyrinomonadaceae bacterium]
ESLRMDFKNQEINTNKKLSNLLLKSILSDGKNSINSFVEWERQIVFDDLDFPSFKLLSAVYLKLPKSFESRLKLRIKGAYRRTWTENQLLLNSLNGLFTALKTANIKFLIADESIRLIEIYNDTGIYSLQNFSIAAPNKHKKEFVQILNKNNWEIDREEFERTYFKCSKSLNIEILWLNATEFSTHLKNADLILIGETLQPIICAEEQILNLCENEFLVLGEENHRCKLIISELFMAQKIDFKKLILLAQKRGLVFQLMQRLEELDNNFDVKIPPQLLTNLRRSKKTGRFFIFKQKIQNLKNSYQMYIESEREFGIKPNFFEFIAKRWKIKSNKVLLKHAVKSGIRLLQTK